MLPFWCTSLESCTKGTLPSALFPLDSPEFRTSGIHPSATFQWAIIEGRFETDARPEPLTAETQNEPSDAEAAAQLSWRW